MTQIDLYKTDDSSNTINKTLTKTGSKNINLLFNYDSMEFQAYLKGDPILLNSNYAVISPQDNADTSFKIFTTNYSYDQQAINLYSTSGYSGTWAVNESTSNLKVGDTVYLRCTNTSKASYDFVIAKVAEIPGDKFITSISLGLKKEDDTNGRHYFINLENIGGTIYIVTFTLDLLETYKDILLASDFDIIEKSTFGYSSEIPTSTEIEQKTINSDKELEFTKTIILTSTGEELS